MKNLNVVSDGFDIYDDLKSQTQMRIMYFCACSMQILFFPYYFIVYTASFISPRGRLPSSRKKPSGLKLQ